jgi:hypothetical protein
MMVPSLLILRIGPGRGIPLPLPLFLLWPFFALAALLVGAAYLTVWLFGGETRAFAKAHLAGRMLLNLRGLKIDVRSHDGTRVYFRII